MFKDEGVRSTAGQLLQRKLSTTGASVRSSLASVLAKVQEADALRSLLRGRPVVERDAALVDLEVRGRVYEDVPRRLRTDLWLSLLDQQEPAAHSGAAAAKAPEVLDDIAFLLCEGDDYERLVASFGEQPAAPPPAAAEADEGFVEDVGAVISRDISRTFPTHAFFARPAGRQALQRVLHAYAVHDPAVGCAPPYLLDGTRRLSLTRPAVQTAKAWPSSSASC